MIPWKQQSRIFSHFLKKGHVIRSSVIKKYLDKPGKNKFQIAPGELPVKQKGWITGDLYTGDIFFNALNPLPFPDNSLDYIFSEHFLEHLDEPSALKHLKASLQSLKPGGKIRISVPDLEYIVKKYSSFKKNQELQRKFKKVLTDMTTDPELRNIIKKRNFFSSEWINVNFYVYDHHMMWDAELLSETLKAIGFVDIEIYKDHESDDPHLRDLERHGEVDPLNSEMVICVEGKKPKNLSPKTHERSEFIKYSLQKSTR